MDMVFYYRVHTAGVSVMDMVFYYRVHTAVVSVVYMVFYYRVHTAGVSVDVHGVLLSYPYSGGWCG